MVTQFPPVNQPQGQYQSSGGRLWPNPQQGSQHDIAQNQQGAASLTPMGVGSGSECGDLDQTI